MKETIGIAFFVLLGTIVLLPQASFADSTVNQETKPMAESHLLSDGEVRKIDKEAGKITIKHGPIKHLDMPPMNMVFTAKDKSLLDKVKVGDKIRFMAADESGKLVVTGIQLAK